MNAWKQYPWASPNFKSSRWKGLEKTLQMLILSFPSLSASPQIYSYQSLMLMVILGFAQEKLIKMQNTTEMGNTIYQHELVDSIWLEELWVNWAESLWYSNWVGTLEKGYGRAASREAGQWFICHRLEPQVNSEPRVSGEEQQRQGGRERAKGGKIRDTEVNVPPSPVAWQWMPKVSQNKNQ